MNKCAVYSHEPLYRLRLPDFKTIERFDHYEKVPQAVADEVVAKLA